MHITLIEDLVLAVFFPPLVGVKKLFCKKKAGNHFSILFRLPVV
jgi:hypothetical protein